MTAMMRSKFGKKDGMQHPLCSSKNSTAQWYNGPPWPELLNFVQKLRRLFSLNISDIQQKKCKFISLKSVTSSVWLFNVF